LTEVTLHFVYNKCLILEFFDSLLKENENNP